jgi:hypothetical protein
MIHIIRLIALLLLILPLIACQPKNQEYIRLCKFEEGDIVYLKSSNQPMVVEYVYGHDYQYNVVWTDILGQPQEKTYSQHVLHDSCDRNSIIP